jgi:cyclic beta-1,2-glucan synthetase
MWREFSIDWRVGGATYHIAVQNPDHRSSGVRAAALDGLPVDPDAIPLLDDGQRHDLLVELGEPPPRLVPSSARAITGSPTR